MMRALQTRLQLCRRLAIGLGLGLGLVCAPALAHKGSDAYLDIQQLEPSANPGVSANAEKIRDFGLVLAVAIRDLDLVVPLDANADGRVTWGEVKAAMPQVLALFDQVAQLDVPAGTQAACALHWQADGLERRSDGVYLRATARARCPLNQALRFKYSLLRDQDATHRLLVAGRIGGKDLLSTMSPQQGSLLLSPEGGTQVEGTAGGAQAAAGRASGRWSTLRDYFGLGMHHLLQGYDHLAFLLALVLPLRLSLLRSHPAAPSRENSGGVTATGRRRATWLALLRTVTAFTIGHSITLMLATFGLTQASPLWVEPAIALSIAVTALLNLHPVKWIRVDVLALLFGLVHGYGFAGLLLEAAAPGGLLPWALAGFNLGVEAGQLTAVLGWVLVSQAVVGRSWYATVVVRGGSALLVLLAAWWFWQRVS
ncbi:HupE/UreJ family protein [Polaromonas sp.]|uniref:HupE/UreJ family protein n=1 Tax=Polaromonas sp. TaxID=1869339 RepID=UPI0017BCE391|nr:HupE/UreJ family protein [Polaromonas sp.]NML87273.1 HupE/UreJ family protein [Polaromonas sp.]